MPESVRYGPDNPHPLSKMRTELVWDGKYDEYGNRRPVDTAGSAMPMQNFERIDVIITLLAVLGAFALIAWLLFSARIL